MVAAWEMDLVAELNDTFRATRQLILDLRGGGVAMACK